MKRNIIWLVCAFLMMLSFTGCSYTEGNCNTDTSAEKSEEGSFADAPPTSTPVSSTELNTEIKESQEPVLTWSKYDICPEVEQLTGDFPIEAYKAAYDAADAAKPTVDLSAYKLSQETGDELVVALSNRINYEFFYVNYMVYKSEDASIHFYYHYKHDELVNRKCDFENKVNDILENVIPKGASDFRKVMTLYKYFVDNTTFEDNSLVNTVNAYSVIVNGKGVCLGYSNAIRYLLTRAGVECISITSDDFTHMWNIVKINGEYYHLDATVENRESINYFLMTDERRQQNDTFADGWYVGNQNYAKPKAPACTSERYSYLWGINSFSMDDNGISFIDIETGKETALSWAEAEAEK